MATNQQTANFFLSEDVARKRTLELSLLFLGAIVLEVVGFVLVVAAVYLMGYQHYALQLADTPQAPLDFPTALRASILYAAPVVLAVLLIGFIVRTIQLRNGGYVIADMMGGEVLPDPPQTLADKTLKDIVDEMAIASGVQAPAIYVLRHEATINAFAAGRAGDDAIIGVTAGALEKLSRDELQGVVAHEFSHLFNGDARLNMRTLAVVYALASISFIGYVMVRLCAGVRGGRNGGAVVLALFLIGIALIILGILGSFLGRLVRAAVCRQRESLADASAVQYTRNASAVAGALYKTATVGSTLAHHRAEELDHFLYADGVESAWHKFSFLATHPPVEKRIRAIDPSFMATQFTWKDDPPADPSGNLPQS